MPRKPYIVGIVGGSASGKTSFLRDLVAGLPARACCVVSQDNYYRCIDEQERDAQGFHNFDMPTSFHRDHFHDDMCRLIRGEAVTRAEYTFNHRDRPGRLITLEPADILIMEGLFVFHFEEIRTLIDLRIFVDAREDICKQRRLQRDLQERGYPIEQTTYLWENHVLPAYRQFILPYREEAHLIVTNHGAYDKALDVVLHHLQTMIARQAQG